MSNPTAAMIVIGDEILSGRTRDSNMHHLAKALTDAAIPLKEVRVIPDDHDEIVAAVQALSGAHTHVFTSGGIGPTHDDITADAVADAFGAHLDVRDDARALMDKHYAKLGVEMNDARLRMARIPDGAALIDNPVSIAPGFTLENVHVMAGVPAVFEAMVASVLSGLQGGAPLLSRSFRVNRPEGEIAGPLGDLANAFPDLSIGSYPYIRDGRFGASLVLRGTDKADLDTASAELCRLFPDASEETPQ